MNEPNKPNKPNKQKDYREQKAEIVHLNLLQGNFNLGGSILASMGVAQSRQKEIQANRNAYLSQHSPAEIKARWPRVWHEVWPHLGQ